MERDLGFEVARVFIGPRLPIQASGNLSFKTSVTKQLKWAGAPSRIKITLLTISCSKVSICGNTYFLSYSGFKSRPSFSMTLYYGITRQKLNVLVDSAFSHVNTN